MTSLATGAHSGQKRGQHRQSSTHLQETAPVRAACNDLSVETDNARKNTLATGAAPREKLQQQLESKGGACNELDIALNSKTTNHLNSGTTRTKLEEIGKLPSYSTACNMPVATSRAYVTQAPSRGVVASHGRAPLQKAPEIDFEADSAMQGARKQSRSIPDLDQSVPDAYSKVKAYLNLDPDLMVEVTSAGEPGSLSKTEQKHEADDVQETQFIESYVHFQKVDSFEDNECVASGSVAANTISSTAGGSSPQTTSAGHLRNLPRMTSRVQDSVPNSKDGDGAATSRAEQRMEAGSPTSSVYDNVAYQWQPKSGSRVHHFHF